MAQSIRYSFTAAALALAFVAGGCTSQSSSARPAAHNTSNRKLAPDFSLKDANGNTVKLSEFRGKVILLNFWATWCGPCALEIPWFVEFQQQYRNQGLEIVGISMDEEGWSVVKPYIAQRKINYRVLLGNDSVGQLYGGVESLPTTFVIDREGRIAYPPHIGLAAKNEYLNEIQTLLKDQSSGDRRTTWNAAGTRSLLARVTVPGSTGAATPQR